MDGTVLVADDDRTIRTVLTQALTRAGCKVHATSSLTTLMRWVAEGRGDVVISDVVMPDGNGLEMLPKIAQDRPGLPVIVISAQNTIMTAIQAEEAEAYDYLPKPFDLPDLMKRTARALETRGRQSHSSTTSDRPEDLPLIGRTQPMQTLYRLLAKLMNTEIPVLITGESGTGKTLIARAIHDFSDRRSQPVVTVSATDLADKDGPARILARARGGTIVLDEIADFDAEAQGRVVRMMDTSGGRSSGEQPPRFIATSLGDMSERLTAGQVRSDLYYRLSGAVVDVPPLRSRVDDIPLLAAQFLKLAAQDGQPERHLSDRAIEVMRNYSWPGNVRQLENTVQRLGLMDQIEVIGRDDVAGILDQMPGAGHVAAASPGETLSESVARHLQRYFDLHGNMLPPPGLYARIIREAELPLIEIALDATGGNQAKCADLLGINRNTLRKKITELDIRVTRRRKLM